MAKRARIRCTEDSNLRPSESKSAQSLSISMPILNFPGPFTH